MHKETNIQELGADDFARRFPRLINNMWPEGYNLIFWPILTAFEIMEIEKLNN